MVSTTTSAPPPVISRTRATTSPASALTVASAPSSRAIASFCSSRPSPVMTICLAPAARAAITQQSPRCPAPRTTTRSPGPVAGTEAAHESPAASGLNITATPAGIVASIFLTTV